MTKGSIRSVSAPDEMGSMDAIRVYCMLSKRAPGGPSSHVGGAERSSSQHSQPGSGRM